MARPEPTPRVSTDGGSGGLNQPFAALRADGLPAAPVPAPAPAASPSARPARSRGRVDLLREKSGRAGKTVTVVCNFTGVSGTEREDIARRLQRRCGCGGAIKDGRIEIQGDQREAAAALLAELGFRPVFAGG